MSNKPGISLVELLIVIALIAIVASLTLSSTTFLSRMIVRAELEHLSSVCYYLQRKALTVQKPQKITFYPAKHKYKALGKIYRLPAHVRFGAADGVKGPPATPKDTIAKAVTFPSNQITFHPTGIIASGAVYLTDAAKSCTYALSCAVSPVSYLRKYQYTDGWNLIS